MVRPHRNTAATPRAFRYRLMANAHFFSTSGLGFVISVSSLLEKMNLSMQLHW
jgi:hypothetical protein